MIGLTSCALLVLPTSASESSVEVDFTGDYCERCNQTASQGLEYIVIDGDAYLKAVGNCVDSRYI